MVALTVMNDVVAMFTELAWQFAGRTTGRVSFKSERVMFVSLCVVKHQVYVALQLHGGIPFAIEGCTGLGCAGADIPQTCMMWWYWWRSKLTLQATVWWIGRK
jgi:hypothetical protein